MQFSREGVAGEITKALEDVVRPGHAQVAVSRRDGEHRWVCLLVDGDGRYYELDRNLSLKDFPCLREGGFQPLPQDRSRTVSIYRSVAKRAMEYDADRGDRLTVVLCPKGDWPKLSLAWPMPGAK